MSQDGTQPYVIRKTTEEPGLDGKWDGAIWGNANTVEVSHFHPRSSDHHPETKAKLLYTKDRLYVHFRVDDRYVISKYTGYMAMVCKDSCVEFFVEPKPGKGYFNFEVNCGGTLHLSYIEDPTPVPGGFAKMTRVPWAVASRMRIAHSLPVLVLPEVEEPVKWYVEYSIPFTVFEEFVGPLGNVAGQEWRANFYKCADESSHPHWGMWSPITNKLSFHQPQFFAPIRFEK